MFAVVVSALVNSVSFAGEAFHEAVKEVEIWKGLAVEKPGIYRSNGVIFSFAEYVPSESDGDRRPRDLAAVKALRQAAYEGLKEYRTGNTAVDELGRRYGAVRLSFPARTLIEDCDVRACWAVVSVKEAALQKAVSSTDEQLSKQLAVQAFRKAPLSFSEVFWDFGLRDIALLAEMRKLPKAFSNVRGAFLPTNAVLMAAIDFSQKKQRLLIDFLEKNKKQPALKRLPIAAMNAVDSPVDFCQELKANAIEVIEWVPKTPVLRQVARAQGFVRMDKESSIGEGRLTMDFVKRSFKEGRNLELMLAILEREAEIRPEDAEVWEYLSAGYLAAKKTDAALVCARAWLALSKSAKEPLQYLLTKFKREGKAVELAALLE